MFSFAYKDLIFRAISEHVRYRPLNGQGLAYLLVLDCGHVVQHSEHQLPRRKALCWSCTYRRIQEIRRKEPET